MTAPDPARARFIALALLRVGAALMVGAGVVLAFGDHGWVNRPVATYLGIALIVAGFLEMMVVVPMLVRRWRSPDRSR